VTLEGNTQNIRPPIILKAAGLWVGGGMLVFLFTQSLDWLDIAKRLRVPARVGMQIPQATALVGGACLAIGLLYLTRPDRLVQQASCWLGQARRAERGVMLLILAYVLAFGWMVIQRHVRFNSAGYDLGLQNQVVWSTSRGYLFHSSLEAENYLGDHFQPLMAILGPLYWLAPTVYWLLAFQTVVLALGAIPLFRLTRRRCASPLAGIIFALVYLLYPAVGYINRFDFHWEATVVPLLLVAANMVDTGRLGWASACLGLAMLGKEEIGLTVSIFGLVAALRGHPKFGLAWGIAGVTFSLVALFVLLPLFRSTPSDTLNRYAWLGGTPAEMLEAVVTHPEVLLQKGIPSDTLTMGFQLLAPVAGLPVLAPGAMMVALPSIGYNLLSSFPPQHTICYQYVAPTVPFVLIAAAEGMARLQRWLSKRIQVPYVRWGVWIGLLLFIVHGTAADSPLADAGVVPPAFTRLPNEAAVRSALSYVPPEASVFTTNHYAPHLSQRYTLYVFVHPEDVGRLNEVNVVFLNVRDRRSVVSELTCDDYKHFLDVSAQDGFGVIFSYDGMLVLQREKGCELTDDLIERVLETCRSDTAIQKEP
jgi:uncharacterized membrane protein